MGFFFAISFDAYSCIKCTCNSVCVRVCKCSFTNSMDDDLNFLCVCTSVYIGVIIMNLLNHC